MHTEHRSFLITAREFDRLLASGQPVSVLDCRASLTDPEYGLNVWLEGHIAGSVFLDLHTVLADKTLPGGRFPLPEPWKFVENLAGLGVSSEHSVVVLDDAGGRLAAARAWWMLYCWMGHAKVSVLDGGLTAWKSTVGTLVSSDPDNALGCLPTRSGSEWSVTNHALVDAGHIEERGTDLLLLDGRSEVRFTGEHEPLDSVAGHIPGAICRPADHNLEDDGTFKAAGLLRDELPVQPNMISYCGGGVAACHNILAYAVAGLPLPRLYAGSWSDWVSELSRPVVTGR